MNDTQLLYLKSALRLARLLPVDKLDEEKVSDVNQIISYLQDCIAEETEKFEREMETMAAFFNVEVNPVGVKLETVSDFIKKHNF